MQALQPQSPAALQPPSTGTMSGRRMSSFNLSHSGIDQRQLPKRVINVVKHLPYSVVRGQDGEFHVKQLSLGPIVSAYRLMKEVGK